MIIKNQENLNLNEKTTQTQMLELPEKDFEAAIIKMLQQTVINMLRTNGKI